MVAGWFYVPDWKYAKAATVYVEPGASQIFFIIVKNVMIEGLEFKIIWKEILILLGMTFFFYRSFYQNLKSGWHETIIFFTGERIPTGIS